MASSEVELFAYNEKVSGSIPLLSNLFFNRNGGMVDASGLGSGCCSSVGSSPTFGMKL